MALPRFEEDLNTLRLSFWMKPAGTNSDYGRMELGVMTDLSDSSTFTLFHSWSAEEIGSTNWAYYELDLDTMINGGNSNLVFRRYVTGTSLYGWYFDDVKVMPIPDCESPREISALPHSYSADITWDDMSGTYNIYYKKDTDAYYTSINNVVITDTVYELDNLAPSTTYVIYVKAVCEDGSSVPTSTAIHFTTLCAPEATPYSEDFNASNTIPNCWERYTGLVSDAFAGINPTPTTSGWVFNKTYAFGEYHPKVNIYGSNCKYWLVSPAIDLSGLGDPALTFDMALTKYNNDTPIADPTSQADDRFLVLISTDDGATWSAENATEWNNNGTGNYVYNQIPNTGEEVLISLAQYEGQTIRIAFYGESTVLGGDNDLHIDNVMVKDAPTCPKPAQLHASNITTHSAELSWTETGNAIWWVVEYGLSGFTPGSETEVHVGDGHTSIVLYGLTPGTDYEFHVKADCGAGDFSDPKSATFRTADCEALTTPFTEDFENYTTSTTASTGIAPACWELVQEDVAMTDATRPQLYYTNTFAHSGNYCLKMHNRGIYAMPALSENIAMKDVKLEMYLRQANAAYQLQVGVWEEEEGTFVPVATFNNSTTEVEHVECDFSNYTGGGHRIAFRNVLGGGKTWDYSYNYIDDITLTEIPLTPTALPYFTDFSEEDDQNWLLRNGNCVNRWMIDTPDENTPSALFITQDGSTASYNISNSSTVMAEKAFFMPSTDFVHVEFDVQVGGDNYYDFLKVFLTPIEEMFEAGTNHNTQSNASYSTSALDFTDYKSLTGNSIYPYMLNLTNGNMLHVSANMPNPNPNGTGKIVFLWRNDNYTGTQPGVVVTNFSIEEFTNENLLPPTVTTDYFYNITTNSAECHGNVTDNGGASLTARGVCFNTTPNPTLEDGYVVVSGSGLGEFSSQLTGLSQGTTYYVRAYATNLIGTSYGEEGSFTTDCGALTLPYSDDFDSYTTDTTVATGIEPGCWTLMQEDVSMTDENRPQLIYNSDYTHSGDYSLRLKYRGVYVMPEMAANIAMNRVHLEMYLKQPKTYYALEVGVWEDDGTFVPVATFNNSTTGMERVECDFSNYTGSGRRIAFHNIPVGNNIYNYSYNFIDDIVLNDIAMVPVALPYSTNFGENANLNWLFNNGSCTNYWTMGSPDENTPSALFVTQDGGSANYNIWRGSTVMVEKAFLMPADDLVHVEFDVLAGGEQLNTSYAAPYDYLKVFLTTVEETFIPTVGSGSSGNTQSHTSYNTNALNFSDYKSQTSGNINYPYLLNLTNGNTIHVSTSLQNPNPSGPGKIVFLWRNDQQDGTQPGAVITNFSIEEAVVYPPAVTTGDISDVTANTATCGGNVTDNGGLTVTERGVCWSTSPNPTLEDAHTVNGNGLGEFVSNLTNLSLGVTYYIRAYATNGAGTGYGEEVSFSACDPITQLPYTDDFESYTESTTAATGIAPICWELVQEDVTMTDATRPQLYYKNAYAHSGNYSLLLNYRGVYAMPTLSENIAMKFMRLKMYLRQPNAAYRLQVGVWDDETSTFTPVATFNNSTTEVEYVECDFSNYTGNGRRIAFRNILGSGNYAYSYNYIDDIALTETAPAFSYTTENVCNSVSVHFENNSTEAENATWDFGDGTTSEEFAPTHTYQESGTYVVTLSVNNGVCEEWLSVTQNVTVTMPETFTISIPYSDNFDSYTADTNTATGVEPSCWELVQEDVTMTDENRPQLIHNSNYTHSGDYSLRLKYRGIYAMPPLSDDLMLQHVKLEMYLKQPKSYYALEVGVWEDDGTFVPVATFNNSTTGMKRVECDFSNYTGSGRRIAFHNIPVGNNIYDYSYNFIDDLVLTESEGCELTIEMHDLYNDGWTGNKIRIHNDGTKKEVTLSSGSAATATVKVHSGHIALEWVNGQYPNDCSFTVTGPCLYYQAETVPAAGVFYETDLDCNNNGTPAIPAFTWWTENTCNSVIVHFVNESSDAEFADWDFGDGDWSNEYAPVHEYTSDGTYPVMLSAYNNACGNASDVTNLVTVTMPEPLAGDTTEFIICYGNFPQYWTNNLEINGPGIYTTVIEASNGCDSIVTCSISVTNPITIPYTEDFESYTESTIAATDIEPSCWDLVVREDIMMPYNKRPQLYYRSDFAHSGDYSLLLNYRGIYAMPILSDDIALKHLHLGMYLRQPKAAYQLEVGVWDDETETFEPITTFNNSTTEVEFVECDFSNYTGNGRRIAFHNVLGSGNYAYSYNYIDDIVLTESEGCATLTFEMHDAYGDGWNGNTIRVYTDGIVKDVTLEDGADGTVTVQVYNGPVELEWIFGSKPEECTFSVSGPCLYYSSDGTSQDGIFLSKEIDCNNNSIPAVPAFSYWTENTCNSVLVHFENESTNAENVYWTFGDGTSSEEYSPTHEYLSSGIYGMRLYVRSSTCDTWNSVVQYVEVEVKTSTYILSDDFNDGTIDPLKWTYSGNSVYEEDGVLKLYQDVTDQYVRLRSTNLNIPASGKVAMDRKFLVHRSSNYYYGSVNFYFNGGEDQQNFVGIQYNYSDYEGWYGIHLVYKLIGEENETRVRLYDASFDTWLTEHVEIDFTTGALTYFMDSVVTTVNIPGLASQTVDYYNVEFRPYGWWTGHEQHIDNVDIYDIPGMVTTSYVNNITATDASCGGSVTEEDCVSFSERGVCWSTKHYPTTNDSHTIDGSGTGEFTSLLTDLMPGTTYFVRAYATNIMGTAYGNEIQFKTCGGNITLPYSEDFESYSESTTAATGVEPRCWELVQEDVEMTDANRPQLYYKSEFAHSGNYSLLMNYRGVYAMPPLDENTAMKHVHLEMYLRQPKAPYRLQVGVWDDETSTFTPVATINNSTTEVEHVECDFSNYTGNGRRIAFRNVLGSGSYAYSYNYIDDIVLTETEGCELTVENNNWWWNEAWNGGSKIRIHNDGSVKEVSFENETGGTKTVTVHSGPIELEWMNGYYPYDCNFTITGPSCIYYSGTAPEEEGVFLSSEIDCNNNGVQAFPDYISYWTENTCNGVLVHFVNESANAENAVWDFGDGTTSEEFAPTHEYTADGNYSVTVAVNNNECENWNSTTFDVWVTMPEPVFSILDTIVYADALPMTWHGQTFTETSSFTSVLQAANGCDSTVIISVRVIPENDAQPCPGTPTVTDIEGNVYNTVQIGNQCWMRENLRTTKKADSTDLLFDGHSYTDPYYYVYESSELTLEKRGYLYNWPAAKVVCPTGWHLPSEMDWINLTDYLGSVNAYVCDGNTNNIAKALASTEGWKTTDPWWDTADGICDLGNPSVWNNASGFSAIPAGGRGSRFDDDCYANFWSASRYASGYSIGFHLSCTDPDIYLGINERDGLLSVRCIQNDTNCAVITLPYVEDFETYTESTTVSTGIEPACWELVEEEVQMPDSKRPQLYFKSDFAHSGDYSLLLNYRGVYAMPKLLDGITVNQVRLDMYLRQAKAVYQLEVGIWDDEEETFVPVVTFDNSTTEVEHVECDFSNYTGNGRRIAFRNVLGGGANYAYSYNYIDDITLTAEIPAGDAQPCPGHETVTDIDGNVYNTVKIGEQCWMKENLRTAHYTDGTYISVISVGNIYSYNGSFCCIPNNDENNLNPYGYLYNWDAIMHEMPASSANPSGVQGICPIGWHVPSHTEWTQLIDYVESTPAYQCGSTISFVAKALSSTMGWNSFGEGCSVGNYPFLNNTTGFDAVPAGNGNYGLGLMTEFWSTTESGDYYLIRYLDYASPCVGQFVTGGGVASVRCLRDNIEVAVVTTSTVYNVTTNSAICGGNVTYDGNDSVTARGVCWSTEPNPTIDDNYTLDGTGMGTFTSTLTYLEENTTYYVRAYATNSVGTAYGEEVSFTTEACNAITITEETPWFEDFESYSGDGGQAFICWSTPIELFHHRIYPCVYCGHESSCHSGANSAELRGDNMLVLPDFTNDIHELRLSFWATTTNINNYGTAEIGVITDINDPASFEVLELAGTPGPRSSYGNSGNGNFMGPFDFNGIQATTGRIAIRLTSYLDLSWNLDDFTVEIRPNIPAGDAQPCPGYETVTDIDGNVYNTVKIGEQCWLKENLRVTHFANGDSIPVGGSAMSGTEPFYYDYSNSGIPLEKRGYLYNWAAAMHGAYSSATNPSNVQGICPNGWHLPSDAEWTQLTDYVRSNAYYWCNGSSTNIAKALADTNGWDNDYYDECSPSDHSSLSVHVNNATGFSAIPAGLCDGDVFNTANQYANFWSSTETGDNIWNWGLLRLFTYWGADIEELSQPKERGYSVRCVLGEGYNIATVTTDEVTNITQTSATCGGNVTSSGNTTIIACGVCWSTEPNPTVENDYTVDGSGTGAFISTLIDLMPSTTYYVRAYATNSMGTVYGEEVSFTTPAIPNDDAKPCPGTPIVTDHEGNVYNTVKIGSQCWMKENLRTTTSPTTGTYLIPPAGTNYTYTGKQAFWYDNDSASYASQSFNQSIVFSEDFSGITDSTAYPSISNSLDDYTQMPGWTGEWIYPYNGKVKVGKSSAAGFIQTPALDLSGNNGQFVVTFDAKAWPNDTTNLILEVDGVPYTVSGLSTTDFQTFSIPFYGGTESSVIKFQGGQETKGRFFLDNVIVTSQSSVNYGLLYNWNAAVDTFNTAYGETSVNTDDNNAVSATFTGHRRGICPVGWHLPSDAEWTQLTNYVGSVPEYQCGESYYNIAKALASTEEWNSSTNSCAVGNDQSSNNATGFSAVPAGYCIGSSFGNASNSAFIWSSTQDASDPSSAYGRNLDYYIAEMRGSNSRKYFGSSVRCLRDETDVTENRSNEPDEDPNAVIADNTSVETADITAPLGIEEPVNAPVDVIVYPNPTKDVVNVQCTMSNVQCTGIEIVDVYGKIITTVGTRFIVSADSPASAQSPVQINVSGLAAGMYFVRVTTDKGVVTKPFVKR